MAGISDQRKSERAARRSSKPEKMLRARYTMTPSTIARTKFLLSLSI